MNSIFANIAFPFGLPGATAFYLSLYILTFALHQSFMHYVLAGSLYVAFSVVRPGSHVVPRVDQPLAATLRDWMPFVLSAAITAGVAPLLFIQIVYQYQFYTANLLLWWRWMLVVPVLIVAFYLLYLLKSSMLWNWPYFVRTIVAIGTAACFVFVGFCWTANHLIANSEAEWADIYATGRLPLFVMIVIPRMSIWIGGSFATMAVIAGWQLLRRQSSASDVSVESEARTLAQLSIGGLSVAVLSAIAYFVQCDSAEKSLLTGGLFLPYLVMTIAGVVAQGFGWRIQWRSNELTVVGLSLASAGCLFGLLGVSVMREGLRVRAIDLASLSERHAQAATVGGFWIFAIAVVIVGLLIGWCLRMVQPESSS